MKKLIDTDGAEESSRMPVNGAATNGGDGSSPDLPEGNSIRANAKAKDPSAKQASPRRRRIAKAEAAKTNGGERYFLATPDRDGAAPSLGRECSSEAEAIIDAFRGKLNFYKVCEFQTRADIEPSGDPVLRKEVVRNNYHPAS
jgi:hypothetical protein